MKDAKGDLYETSEVLATTDLAYYCGEDAINLPMLALGAVGVVSVVVARVRRQLRRDGRAPSTPEISTKRGGSTPRCCPPCAAS